MFDIEKLKYINAHHQRLLTLEDYTKCMRDYLFDDAKLKAVCELVQKRTETLGEFMDMADFFFGDVCHYTPETRKLKQAQDREPAVGLIPKGKERDQASWALSLLQEWLDPVQPWTAAGLEASGLTPNPRRPGAW